jgi:hypothetical protein
VTGRIDVGGLGNVGNEGVLPLRVHGVPGLEEEKVILQHKETRDLVDVELIGDSSRKLDER